MTGTALTTLPARAGEPQQSFAERRKRLLLWKLPQERCHGLYAEALRAEDRDAVRWLARNDRYFLLTHVLRRKDAIHPWIFARVREVERRPFDHLDLWAREHYKSTIITFAGAIQAVLRDPEVTIGIFAHNRATAKKFLNQIKTEFEDNAFLKWLFPEICYTDPRRESLRWGEDTGIVVRRKTNPKEATVEACGLVDGMPTGAHFRGRIYDDVVTEKAVTTEEMIDKVTEMFDLSQNLGVAEGGWVCYVGTRYHYGDTYGKLIDRGVITERRHAATHDGTFNGKPVFLSDRAWQEKLTQPKRTVAAQQLLNPLAGAEQSFEIDWIKYWYVRPRYMNVYILGDPSKGKTEDSDFTAFAVIGIGTNGGKYLLDGYRHRMSLSQRWFVLRELFNKWSRAPGIIYVGVGYEEFGLQTDLEYFEERMLREKIPIHIEKVAWPREGRLSKRHRIERLEPDFKSGRFMWPGVFTMKAVETRDIRYQALDNSGRDDVRKACEDGSSSLIARPFKRLNEDKRPYDVLAGVMEEYRYFPYAPHDDFLDACSRLYDMDPVIPSDRGTNRDDLSRCLPPLAVDGV